MNKRLLKSKIALHGDTQVALAKDMGIHFSKLNLKMNEYTFRFNEEEIKFIKQRYNLTEEEVQDIFFN